MLSILIHSFCIVGSLAHTGAQAQMSVIKTTFIRPEKVWEPVGLSHLMSVMKTISKIFKSLEILLHETRIGSQTSRLFCYVFRICMFTTNRSTNYTSFELGNQLATDELNILHSKTFVQRTNLQRALIKVNLVMDPMRGCRQLRFKPKTKFF